MTEILMPKATAVWLVDNTSLTFDQIADFCGLHPLEVKGIADGDVATGVRGADPISNGQLTREEIGKAEDNSDYRMSVVKPKYADLHQPAKRRGPRYTPLSRRQNRPDAIAWLVRNHPELADAQISKLIGTTKTTIQAVRERTHWNAANIKPTDPVSLGLCTQIDLDEQVKKASARRKKIEEENPELLADTLKPTDELETPENDDLPTGEINLETLFGGSGSSDD
ncbi:MAG: cell cycle transcriptional regulator TrcR [Pseudomonadota bacterium]|nr:cell cycle transcriptional regulator TrcR [Pseudomonadota bacterium]